MSDIELVQANPQRVYGVRRHGSYQIIPNMIMELFQVLRQKGVDVSGPPIYLCHESSMADVEAAMKTGFADIEVAWPIALDVDPEGDIKTYVLPGGEMAKIIHRGPYEQTSQTYKVLFAWIAAHGKRIVDPIRESYLNDPRTVKPEDIITEIYAPIA